MTGVHIESSCENTDTKGEHHVIVKADAPIIQGTPRITGKCQKLVAKHGIYSSSDPPTETNLDKTLISNFLPLEL